MGNKYQDEPTLTHSLAMSGDIYFKAITLIKHEIFYEYRNKTYKEFSISHINLKRFDE